MDVTLEIPEKKKLTTGQIAIIVIAVILLLVGLSVGLYFAFKPPSEEVLPDPEPIEPVEPVEPQPCEDPNDPDCQVEVRKNTPVYLRNLWTKGYLDLPIEIPELSTIPYAMPKSGQNLAVTPFTDLLSPNNYQWVFVPTENDKYVLVMNAFPYVRLSTTFRAQTSLSSYMLSGTRNPDEYISLKLNSKGFEITNYLDEHLTINPQTLVPEFRKINDYITEAETWILEYDTTYIFSKPGTIPIGQIVRISGGSYYITAVGIDKPVTGSSLNDIHTEFVTHYRRELPLDSPPGFMRPIYYLDSVRFSESDAKQYGLYNNLSRNPPGVTIKKIPDDKTFFSYSFGYLYDVKRFVMFPSSNLEIPPVECYFSNTENRDLQFTPFSSNINTWKFFVKN